MDELKIVRPARGVEIASLSVVVSDCGKSSTACASACRLLTAGVRLPSKPVDTKGVYAATRSIVDGKAPPSVLSNKTIDLISFFIREYSTVSANPLAGIHASKKSLPALNFFSQISKIELTFAFERSY